MLESRFRRFLDNHLEEGERMWHLIQHGPYQRPMVPDPTNPRQEIPEPLSKMTKGDKKKYIADVKFYDSLVPFEPHVLASRAKKAAKNHDPLALISHSNASSSHPHAYSSYSP
ncbi:hypothetical protein Tco_0600061 [Tanacetum coccineum]|uniref:Uncharacterized protein n=1 Tax=Tanacetum coccineum TaxID=301880 RepID=A0ABQ4WAQ5_9ASTR